MKTKRLMLDNGAFTVWTKGAVIDLDEYIRFCLAHPDVSYYVSLDVIPGRFRDKKTLRSSDAREASCKATWDNYWKMVQAGVPREKLILVFHQHERTDWLHDYISSGVPYVGISPANDSSTKEKLDWMRSLRHILFDGAGRPVVKTHGFAVTSYALMQEWQWHSVDSASWKLSAAWGGMYVPHTRGGENDYGRQPLQVVVSPNTLGKQRRQHHVSASSPAVKRRLLAYLESIGLQLGSSVTRQVSGDYKLDKSAKEFWVSKKARLVARPVVHGVENDWELRAHANAKFVQKANKVLPVDHIYFAGDPVPNPDVEFNLGRRLLSYHEMANGGQKKYSCLVNHSKLIKGP